MSQREWVSARLETPSMFPLRARAVGRKTSSGAHTRSKAGHRFIPPKCDGMSSMPRACLRLRRHQPGKLIIVRVCGENLR